MFYKSCCKFIKLKVGFCLTTPAAFENKHGNIAGIVVIDVNFREIFGDYGYRN